MKIAVCDDSVEICIGIRNLIWEHDKEADVSFFSSGESLLSYDECFDIIFLDILMNSISGIETAKKLREKEEQCGGEKCVIVFITAFRDFMEDAFDVSAFNYITKPVDRDKFFRVLTAAEKEVAARSGGKYIMVKCRGVKRKFFLCDIYYIESNNKKIVLNTKTGKFEIYGKINEYENLLKGSFFRCHRCYLVNLERICAYDMECIEIMGGCRLPLSKQKYSDFVKTYLRYAREGGNVNV